MLLYQSVSPFFIVSNIIPDLFPSQLIVHRPTLFIWKCTISLIYQSKDMRQCCRIVLLISKAEFVIFPKYLQIMRPLDKLIAINLILSGCQSRAFARNAARTSAREHSRLNSTQNWILIIILMISFHYQDVHSNSSTAFVLRNTHHTDCNSERH